MAAGALGALLTLVASRPAHAAPPLADSAGARATPPVGGAVVEHPTSPVEEEEKPSPERSNNRLALAGGLLFGTSYFFSVLGASFSMASADAKLPELYAPVVGPWIAIPNIIQIDKQRTGGDPAAHNTDFLKPVGFGILGIAQGIGALCLVGYFVDRPSRPERTIAGVRVTPYVSGNGAGLAGSF